MYIFTTAFTAFFFAFLTIKLFKPVAIEIGFVESHVIENTIQGTSL